VKAVTSPGAILFSIMTGNPNCLLHQDLTDQILGAFYRVYNELGSGFVEAVYAHVLTKELRTDPAVRPRTRCRTPPAS
jgi:hypothetical protein